MIAAATLHAELTALFADHLHVRVPSPDTDLVTTGLLDSLGMVELLVNLEQRYGVTVDMRELSIENFRSVESIARFIAASRTNGTGSSAHNTSL
jgi:D-alanine--poly(phosphoribitol) ligase subunit 2